MEKSIKNNASFLRKEIVDISCKMQWLPRADDLEDERFTGPKHLDYFLTNLLPSNEVITDRVARLKLSFSQDLIYEGTYWEPPYFTKEGGGGRVPQNAVIGGGSGGRGLDL